MNIEKYTERARGFIQSAQTFALGQGHQQLGGGMVVVQVPTGQVGRTHQVGHGRGHHQRRPVEDAGRGRLEGEDGAQVREGEGHR